jgi:hypothetical protein
MACSARRRHRQYDAVQLGYSSLARIAAVGHLKAGVGAKFIRSFASAAATAIEAGDRCWSIGFRRG